jgi:hypothetical protein
MVVTELIGSEPIGHIYRDDVTSDDHDVEYDKG